MAISPLGNTFLFGFVSDTKNGVFAQKNQGSIILANAAPQLENQGDRARFGKVLAVGPDVTDFAAGDIVLIEALQWTLGFTHDDVKVWKSDQSKVLAILDGDVEDVLYDYRAV